jgi:putative transposase
MYIKREKHVCSRALSITDIVYNYGIHPVSSEDGGTWYPMTCLFLKLIHHIHSPLEKSLIERTMHSMSIMIELKVSMITILVG